MKKTMKAVVIAGVSVSLLAGCGSKDKTATTTVPAGNSATSGSEEVVVVEESSAMESTAMESTSAEEVVVVEESSMSESAMGTMAEDGAFVSPDGTFSVKFPAEPSETEQDQATPAGSMKLNIYQTAFAGGVFQASEVDMSALGSLGNDDQVKQGITAALDSMSTATVQGMGGTTSSTDPTEVDGRSGKKFTFEVNGLKGVGVVVADGTTIYQVLAASTDADANQAFVDSFKLLKAAK